MKALLTSPKLYYVLGITALVVALVSAIMVWMVSSTYFPERNNALTFLFAMALYALPGLALIALGKWFAKRTAS